MDKHLTFNKTLLVKMGLAGVLATSAAALVIGRIWKPDLQASKLKHWELPTSFYVDVEGLQVHVAKSETSDNLAATNNCEAQSGAETLLLIHGTSASLHTWDGWNEALKEQYCVVRLDLPAFGLTGPYADDTKPYSLDNYVDTVIKVMDKLDIKRATIAGNSLGGGIAWLTALMHPERIDRLILVDASGFKFTPKRMPIGFKLAQSPVLDGLTEHVLPKSMVRSSVQSVYADKSKVSDDLVNRYYELSRRAGNRKALTRRMREGLYQDEVKRLGEITQPTLIIWGAQDELIPIESAYKFKAAIPNSQLVVFDHLGHVPQEEDPKATVAVVKQFLRDTKSDYTKSFN
ncbi:alpha/beta fold hydrolase [Psychrobacter sanguinis]|uniref:Alpha/beta fold hydrolase n=1 Tax=Psychrobacter sanguinis TaxID=861445 RepID=A0A844LZ15_9GAMM|nr:alpha/beta hydrolase [Psychrobacter sanguinis]MUG31804.1 alpha/beta fold hydrolase [Psychrobacter sanguinis]